MKILIFRGPLKRWCGLHHDGLCLLSALLELAFDTQILLHLLAIDSVERRLLGIFNGIAMAQTVYRQCKEHIFRI